MYSHVAPDIHTTQSLFLPRGCFFSLTPSQPIRCRARSIPRDRRCPPTRAPQGQALRPTRRVSAPPLPSHRRDAPQGQALRPPRSACPTASAACSARSACPGAGSLGARCRGVRREVLSEMRDRCLARPLCWPRCRFAFAPDQAGALGRVGSFTSRLRNTSLNYFEFFGRSL